MESNKRTDTQPFQRTPLHLCQLLPTSLELSCQTGVGKLKVSTSVFAYMCMKGWGGEFLQCLKVAPRLQRTKLAADLSFPKGCRTGEVETCLYTCNHMSARTVGKMLIAPLKSTWVWPQKRSICTLQTYGFTWGACGIVLKEWNCKEL